MKIIISENQKDKVLKDLVRNHGWKSASNIVGDDYLVHNVFNDDYNQFLSLFEDLDGVRRENHAVRSLNRPGITLYKNNGGVNVMIYDDENGALYFNRDYIYNILDLFKKRYFKDSILQEWLGETYNIHVKKNDIDSFAHDEHDAGFFNPFT